MLLSDEEIIYWLWITQIPGVGPALQHKLLNSFKSPKEIYFNCENLQKECLLTTHEYDLIINAKQLNKAAEILDKCRQQEIHILTAADSQFPNIMRRERELPILLYYKGNLKKGYDDGIAVIGARRCTNEGKQKAIEIVEKDIDESACVISGMAKGIDSYAHTAALINGRFTLAVLGNSLDICYPLEHQKLMNEIIQHGLLISEYPPTTRPTQYSFPKRNRLIAALSKKIYVIEAGNHSGTRTTVEFGIKYNREIVKVNRYR